MSVVIDSENLYKVYRIPRKRRARNESLRDAISGGLRRGMKNLKGAFYTEPPLGEDDEEIWALKDVNFQIQQGDRVGLIGKNGSGKSTLLRILSRITVPTSGRISITGRVASVLEVGTGFHRELTGRENIFLNGAVLGMQRREIKANFDQIVEFAGIEQFLDTPVKKFSTGMHTRLAFSIASHLPCDILLVDEVLAVSDKEFKEQCINKMLALAHEGRTLVFVSHDTELVRKVCSSGLFLQRGSLMGHGDVGAISKKYLGQENG